MDMKKFERLKQERAHLYREHPQYIGKDCFYNPNLTMQRADCSIGTGDGLDHAQNCKRLSSGKRKLISQDSCSFRLENVLVDQKDIRISGWYILLDTKWNNWYKTQIILQNKSGQYIVDTVKVYRGDMNLIAQCDGKFNLCSFKAVVDSRNIPSGEYQIYLKKQGKVCDTGQKIYVDKNESKR